MTDKEKKVNNSNPQEGVSRFSDDDSMSIQDADISDSEHDLLIRLSQQAQHRRASQNQYHNDINVIGDDSHNDTTASLDLEVVSNEHDIEDHLDDEIIEEDDDDDDNSDNDDNSHDHSDDFEDPDSMSMMETADFLRQLMQARRNRTTEIRNSNSDSAGQSLNEDDDEIDNDEHDNINDDDDNDGDGNEDDEEVEEEEDEDEDDPRAEFLRAIGALTGGNRNSSNGDTSSSGNGGEIDALVNNLSQREDTYIVLESMNELSERLLMMNGLTAERLIPANKLARSLIEIMEDPKLEEELELHLVACRCLYNFLEVNQDFIHDALNNNAIPALCNKLLEIKYIDLTEQALQTLEMISRDPISHNSIISNNGLTACLQYLDFLTIHAQRKCLTIVANSCSNISIGNFPKVKEAFNGIAEVVRNHNDKVVVENAWLTISRIVMCFKNKPDLLNELFADKELLFKELTKVILVSCNKSSNTSSESNQVTLNHGSNLSLIKSLIILVSVSVDVSRILISECEIGSIIVKSLNKYAKQNQEIDPLKTHSDSISIEALMSAPKDLISQFLSLIGYLLPITYSTSDALYLRPNYEQDQERQNINQTRIELCTQLIPNEYWKFVNDIWSLLILSFQATMDFEIRRKGFVNLYRIICSNESDFSLIKDVDFIAGLLANVVTQYQSIVIKEFASVESNDDDMVSTDVEENEELGQASTSQEDEDDYDDEDEDDEVVDEDEDEEFSILDSREDVNKLNSLMLLLSSLKIIKVLLEKAPFTIIGLFEKEGLINDVLRLLKTLSDKADLNEKDPRASINSMMSAYSNKFIDSEFTKEYEYKLTSRVIYSNIVSIATDINSLYQQIKTTLSNHKNIKSFSYNQWLELWNNLKLAFCGSSSPVSSFELISSGAIESLTKLFSTDFGLESSDCYKAFTEAFWKDDSATFLVQKLQEALTRSESFDIVSATSSTNNQSSFARDQNQAAIMANQIKLKLIAEDENSDQSKLPGNMQNMILSVHAIATFKSVFAFLKQRFKFFEELGGSLNRSFNNEDSERKQDLNIEFLINGEVIPNETTIYGVIYRSLQETPDEVVNSSKIWSKVHNITYRKVSSEVSKEAPFTNFNLHYNTDRELSLYDDTTINILKLLKILFRMNNNFSNGGVVASGTLPGWSIHLTKQFPFIFPFETRIFFLQSTSFGYSRLIHQWQLRTNQGGDDNVGSTSTNQGNNQRMQLGRPTRHKVRISRKMMLQSAVKVLGMYGSTPGILEIEYFDEEGSGLGPTLEFYSTVSKEFSKKKLRLWRDEEPRQASDVDVDVDDESYVVNKYGLFPKPMDKTQLSSENGRKVLYFFSSLGKFIARALLDSRIIDFNFNPVFLSLIQLLNKTNGINSTSRTNTSKLSKKMATISNLRLVDPTLADSLQHLNKYIELFESNSDIHNVTVDGARVEDLALFFELPGNPDYELIPNGSDTLVTADNLELYINKVIEATLFSGILTQTKAFMDGFSKVFPINSLIIFSSRELVELFGNAEEDWSMDTLTSSIVANHGYTKESEAIKSLIDILMNFSIEEKREFLQFLTGAPKLPIGGFKALRPELTVVRKHAEDGLKDDDYLPSVMTCANYLKLPNYSSKEMMKEKLIQAMKEGAGAFLLS
ncbi:HECT-domain (ubiquitin-transferase) family protein [Candida albicans]|uniref:HECT-type E3 ubiquitin transferase n=1 Tax=Candida albicans TaxID=5476 RepID=A0A8H6F5E6_CANAX|nr:HECT-domain (ubiquitin-transferase) family protein [Candida albicans]